MLTDLSKNEENILDVIRESNKYKDGNFYGNYHKLSSELRSVLECAKIYILDNYNKIEDYSDLSLTLRCANHENAVYFGKKMELKTKKRIKIFDEIMEDLNNRTIKIISFDSVVWDWSDGDFSVTLNGVDYNWIDSRSIIDIAEYIEERLKKN